MVRLEAERLQLNSPLKERTNVGDDDDNNDDDDDDDDDDTGFSLACRL